MEEKNFGALGQTFQLSLLKTLIEDKKYAVTIIDVMDAKYFDGPYFKYVMANIIELYNQYKIIPDYISLEHKIMVERSKDAQVHLDTLKTIKELEVTNDQQVKDTAMNFCKQQVLKKELKIVEKIIENGNFEEYKNIEEIIQKALLVGSNTNDIVDIFDDIRNVLKDELRAPIPTGIEGIDSLLKGGLSIGELGVILAPTGVGKTTLLTKFANTAFNCGYNVLHIFFEDRKESIMRKHYTIWTGISPDNQPAQIEEVVRLVEQKQSKNKLKLLKWPGDSVTVSMLKSKLRKLLAEGFKPDLIVLDYVDCLIPERTVFGEEWKGEASIMRSLEAMTDEFGVAMWVATQGNRESISSEVVMTDQMGGSIKKAQIGHIVISIGKTLQQKENNLATMTILKSRIGKDGVVFANCKFDNEYLIFDTDTQSTILGHEHENEERKKQHIAEIYEQHRKKQQQQTKSEINKVD